MDPDEDSEKVYISHEDIKKFLSYPKIIKDESGEEIELETLQEISQRTKTKVTDMKDYNPNSTCAQKQLLEQGYSYCTLTLLVNIAAKSIGLEPGSLFTNDTENITFGRSNLG